MPVYAGFSAEEVRRALKRKEPPSYMGTFSGARRYVLQTFATTESAAMKKRVARYLISADCPACARQAAASRGPVGALCRPRHRRDVAPSAEAHWPTCCAPLPPAPMPRQRATDHADKSLVAHRIAEDLVGRLAVLLDLGLGYLALDRSTPTLSPGELQRLRLATQVRSNLFGVVYVLDEPSAGLHPADTEALLRALDRLKASGNSLFVVEHDLDVDPPRRLDRGCRPGRRRARRRDPLQRAAGGARRHRGVADAPLSAGRAGPRGPPAAPAAGLAAPGRR